MKILEIVGKSKVNLPVVQLIRGFCRYLAGFVG